MKFDERVAIVTGAGSGIGRAIAKKLAKVGCKVVVGNCDEVSASTTVDEIRQINQRAIAVVTDVSQQDEAQAIVAESIREYGAVHILVNSAGIMANASITDENPSTTPLSRRNLGSVLGRNFWDFKWPKTRG